ncbi:von Willebrand factor (vWF) type A domain [Rhizoctonia solani]|uniref:von Willebrand factor (VWF) type A domain n=1 Tax=Rhizoctonia solani TaxID=456999 RepID=A0A8H7IMG4_9AGAM|nr:von Willebrand factor (vWF) type A domain [Rhizoctonia solani]
MFSKLVKRLRRDNTPELPTVDLCKEDALAQLMHYDTQFLIDDSGSMAGTRWNEAREALMGLAEYTLKHDQDGIEIFFLNDTFASRVFQNKEEVRQLFYAVKPSGSTPTGLRMEQLLMAYIARIEAARTKSGGQDPLNSGIKPLNLIVITDGEPTDDPRVGIQFIQVGDDKHASKALKELDNHLHKDNNVRDIVDTRPFTGKELTTEVLVAMLLGAINRRVDQIKKPGKE